jgi:hypothetical protein
LCHVDHPIPSLTRILPPFFFFRFLFSYLANQQVSASGLSIIDLARDNSSIKGLYIKAVVDSSWIKKGTVYQIGDPVSNFTVQLLEKSSSGGYEYKGLMQGMGSRLWELVSGSASGAAAFVTPDPKSAL